MRRFVLVIAVVGAVVASIVPARASDDVRSQRYVASPPPPTCAFGPFEALGAATSVVNSGACWQVSGSTAVRVDVADDGGAVPVVKYELLNAMASIVTEGYFCGGRDVAIPAEAVLVRLYVSNSTIYRDGASAVGCSGIPTTGTITASFTG